MRHFKANLVAIFLACLTLFGVAGGADANSRGAARASRSARTIPAPVTPRGPSLYPGRSGSRIGSDTPAERTHARQAYLRHPRFAVLHHGLHLVAAASHHPAPPPPRPLPPPPVFERSDGSDGFFSSGEIDTDTDDGVFISASYRHTLAADLRELDLPLGLEDHPQAPIAWSLSPRAPPVA